VDATVASLLARVDVARARRWLLDRDRHVLELQREIVKIPAPTGDESRRAAFVVERFEALGLTGAGVDRAGNAQARLGDGPGPGIVICSHLDTVFAASVALDVRETNGRIAAPGIGDNARGLAALLTVAEACRACEVRTARPITFIASVGEEGHGDLKGVKHLFEDPAFVPEAFIALDGPGLERVVHRALGSRRLRATFRGPGGHSWAAFGVANPAHAVGLAAARIAEIPLPMSPRASLSVVRIGGGSSLNTIPQDAWLEFDLRSESEAALERLYESATNALARALDVVNRSRSAGTPPLTLHLTPLGQRPSGATSEKHPLVQAALAATRALGATPQLAAASTDANVPISRGVPGIALGAGGKGGDAHLESEWYENAGGPEGILRTLIVAVAAAES
jgi:acetylornithine deacetylase/succinyl-diaminopimelate desuccinylase-like protein